MSKNVTNENMLSVLPGVLKRDDGMFSLAKLIGWIIGTEAENVDAPAVFQNIGKLPEDLLDILAVDCKVDWYDFDADIETKRRQLLTNWKVRERLGTVGAVKTALQSVWPDSTIEEWFEYGGEPGYFRALISLNMGGTIPFNKAVRMIDVFKPVRAHVDGYPILRILCKININTSKESHKYHVPAAGTVPQYYTHGDKSYEDIIIQTEADGPKYHVPVTGEVTAGTYPHYYTHGNSDSGGLDVAAASVSVGYGVRKCGTPLNSLF